MPHLLERELGGSPLNLMEALTPGVLRVEAITVAHTAFQGMLTLDRHIGGTAAGRAARVRGAVDSYMRDVMDNDDHLSDDFLHGVTGSSNPDQIERSRQAAVGKEAKAWQREYLTGFMGQAVRLARPKRFADHDAAYANGSADETPATPIPRVSLVGFETDIGGCSGEFYRSAPHLLMASGFVSGVVANVSPANRGIVSLDLDYSYNRRGYVEHRGLVRTNAQDSDLSGQNPNSTITPVVQGLFAVVACARTGKPRAVQMVRATTRSVRRAA